MALLGGCTAAHTHPAPAPAANDPPTATATSAASEAAEVLQRVRALNTPLVDEPDYRVLHRRHGHTASGARQDSFFDNRPKLSQTEVK
jgi:hypothetical protein